MMLSTKCRVRIAGALMMIAGCLAPAAAGAQAVGSGPLTGTLAETEPQTGALTFARIKLAPGLVVRELGWDDNVFDEAVNPKSDFVASVMPDVSAFSRLRFVQLSAYAGSDLNYYRKFENERSVGHSVKGRVDLLLSRVKPFFGGGQVVQRSRPNGEIDVRADRGERELSAGAGFDLSEYSSWFVAANWYRLEFKDAFEEHVNLSLALNRDFVNYSAGIRTALTPLLTLTVNGAYGEDQFKAVPIRNAKTYSGQVAVRFAPEAIINGGVNIGYRDFRPVDPLVSPFRGITGSAAVTYSFLEVGRLGLVGTRALEFSFDEGEAYYVDNTLNLFYTHRLFGAIDAQARVGRSIFDYSHRVDRPAHRDTLDTAGASVGYNLPNRTRISVNYEYSRRRSPAFAERNYNRRRAYLSWTFAF